MTIADGFHKRIHVIRVYTMAKSKYEYVKKFEQDTPLLPNTWLVVRLDGRGFHKFTDAHKFSKPNDARALNLMNESAKACMKEFTDIILG